TGEYCPVSQCIKRLVSPFDFLMLQQHPKSPHFPYTTLFRSQTSTASAATRLPTTMATTMPWRDMPGLSAPRSRARSPSPSRRARSEEHTSELQSRSDLVCRLLLEKKKKKHE